jgi:hemerythrin-like domain-containing protein
MDAIEMLMQEHRTIEQVLDALVGFADETVRTRRTDKMELSRFVTFLRDFADARHHAKEEGVLFQAMARHGFPTHGGPIMVMLHEHEQGRGLIRVLAGHAGQDGPWNDRDLASLGEAARSYAALLRTHIQKEDAVLYPMAERHVPRETLDEVAEGCRRIDAAGSAVAEDSLLGLADELAAAHGPGARLGSRAHS